VRTDVIVVVSERLAFDFGIFQRQKPVLVDAFGPDLALEEENAKLKKLLAEQMMDASTLREMLGKNF
jgi:hypothetical protein